MKLSRRGRCRGRARGADRARRMPVVRVRPRRRGRHGGRRHCAKSVCPAQCARGIPACRRRHSHVLLAVGRLLAEHVLHGGVPRRAGRGRRQGSARVAPPPAGGIAAHARRAEPGRGEGRVRHAAAGRTRAGLVGRQQHRQLHRPGGGSVRRGRRLRVHRIVCAVDCGQVVNPAGSRTADRERHRHRTERGAQGRRSRSNAAAWCRAISKRIESSA